MECSDFARDRAAAAIALGQIYSTSFVICFAIEDTHSFIPSKFLAVQGVLGRRVVVPRSDTRVESLEVVELPGARRDRTAAGDVLQVDLVGDAARVWAAPSESEDSSCLQLI